MMTARRLWLSCVLSLIAFSLVITRLGYLQLYCHASLSERANRERFRNVPEQWTRGAVLDRDGGVLATSIQGGAVFADPKMIEHVDETARALSPLVHLPASAIKARLTQKRRFVWIARRLDPETAQQIREMKRPGIKVVSEMKRFYPEEKLAAHLLGIVNDEQEGLSGVERTADAWLTGRSTPFLFKQWPLADKSEGVLAAKNDLQPRSVVLTLDKTLQYIVEQELAVQMALSKPKSGTVIVQDPMTGEILAMATAPTFNPNMWGIPGHTETSEALKNPAVEHAIEPGSTYKVVTAAAALELGTINPDDLVFCENGMWQTQGRKIHDHERDGSITFADVIAHSSNIGTAKVALRVGESNLYRFSRAFGFGIPTGIGLPGDGAGILRSPKQWTAGSLITISFGQEVAVTPLQMVNAFSVVANGGMLLEPRLFKGLVDERGQYREWQSHRAIRRVISGRTVAMMRKIFQRVVEDGTGKAAAVPGISVAGKTGTAQKIDPRTRQYSETRYLASFCGFAPADHPRVVIGVFLDEPANSYWGGSEAAPLFSRIVRNAAPYLRLQSSNVGPLVSARLANPSGPVQ